MLGALITPPSPQQVATGLRRLAAVGAIHSESADRDTRITRLGSMMLRLSSVEVLDAYALCLAVALGCEGRALPLVMLMRACEGNIDKLFRLGGDPGRRSARIRQCRQILRDNGCLHPSSEHLSVLSVYEQRELKDVAGILDPRVWEQVGRDCAAVAPKLAKRERTRKALEREGVALPDLVGNDAVLYCLATAYGTCNRLVKGKKSFVSPSRGGIEVILEPSEVLGIATPGGGIVSTAVVSSFGRVKALGLSSV